MKKTYKSMKFIALLGLAGIMNVNAQNGLTYCSAAASSTADDEIFYVSISTLSNSSTCGQTAPGPGSVANMYGNWTTLSPAPLQPGNNYSLTIVVGQCNGNQYSGICGAWIDYNQNGVFTDPGEQIYMSSYGAFAVAGTTLTAAGGITVPAGATGGITRMRIIATESGTAPGPCTNPTWGEVEDYFVFIVGPPCSSSPSSVNSITSPTYAICPNSNATLGTATIYTLGGISYTWASASNSVGPFVAVPGGTNMSLTTPNLTTNTWFQVTAACANGGQPTVLAPVEVSVSPVTISNVPYFEGFEGINGANTLPNCSWVRSNSSTAQTYIAPAVNNRAPRTGNNYASFYYSPAGTNVFYTNGIQMYAGVTYSAAMFYMTEYYGYNTYSLTMAVGPNQTMTGMVPIANAPYAASSSYKKFDNTFTVPTSGIYYIAIRAISNGACCGYYLSWDDLSVTIPCDLNPTSVNIATTGSSTICAGQSINMIASGVDTYTWNTGATTAGISDTPANSMMYSVSGTSTLTGCPATANNFVTVNPTPIVSIVPSATAVCEGGSVNLVAMGNASSYTWSANGGTNGQFVTVTPATATTYTLIGANSANCNAISTQFIDVKPLPTISAQSSAANNASCKDENVTLTGSGGDTYQWMASSSYLQGNPVVVTPGLGTTTYTVIGTNADGCTNTVTIVQQVFACLGVNEQSGALSGLNVYPNPNNGNFSVELRNGLSKTVDVVDVTGRVIMTSNSSEDLMQINISQLANGIYYVKVKSNNTVEVLKVVKQ